MLISVFQILQICCKLSIMHGLLHIELAESRMAALLKLRDRFEKEKPFSGFAIGMALHVTKETAVLVKTLRDGGAKVFITGCNPLSTQDEIVEALRQENNVKVFGKRGESVKEYYENIQSVILLLKSEIQNTKYETNSKSQIQNFKRIITIDDGCDLVTEIHKHFPELIPHIIGGCEETTTGVIRLRAMEKDGALKYPVIAVNDNRTKHLMDNYYGTGQSAIDGILRATNILLAGKTVVVSGYGDCGKGVAMRAKGMGARVIVTEVDPFMALQAHYDGYEILSMSEAAKIGDVFVTVTGNIHVIDAKHFQAMKDGAILANAGHFNHEINVEALEKMASKKRSIRQFVNEFSIGKKRLLLLGEGRLVNLVCAEGHPSEVMSMSFCGQALACEFLVKNQGKLTAQVHVLPTEIDDEIAKLQLQALGIALDDQTPEQRKYASSWEQGT